MSLTASTSPSPQPVSRDLSAAAAAGGAVAAANAAVTPDAIEEARARMGGAVRRTPLLEAEPLNALTGARVLVKAEPLQISGSFKFRGAYNRISQLTPAERKSGIVAWSSGNHAQGVAAAARLFGVKATIVMPSDAPQIKIDRTRSYGADIVFYDRFTEDREAIGCQLAQDRGAVIVPSYDDPHIMTGQGTAGLEIYEQAREMGAEPDIFLVCCGGGGLAAGCGTILRDRLPDLEIYTVEPEGFDDTARSFVSGMREKAIEGARSFCDALLTPTPGHLTFPVLKDLGVTGLTVTDGEVGRAMRKAFTALKLVSEPGGAVALAALLAGKLDVKGKTVALTVSGGNVDPALFAQVLAEAH